MAETNQKPRRNRRRLIVEAAIGIIVLALFVSAAWYIRSERFNEYVRGRVIARLEQVTGGRVELKQMQWNLSQLQFDLRDLTIHGLEAPNEAPYIHVSRFYLSARILSLLGRRISLRYLELDRPVVHLIVYPDGSTNQPKPKAKGRAGSPLEDLFDLAANRVEIKHGVLLVNDSPKPIDLVADDLALTLKYAPRDVRYDGGVRMTSVTARYGEFRPVAGAVDAEFSLWKNVAQLKRLKVWSGTSELQANGTLNDFVEPKVYLAYSASLDMAQLGEMARIPEWRRGTLALNGQGTWRAGEYASTGKLALRDFDYTNNQIRLTGASLGSDYLVNNDKLSLPHIFASALGGTILGDVEVVNWTTPPLSVASASPKSNGEKRARATTPSVDREQSGVAHLHVRNLLMSRMASAVSTRAFPIDRVNLAGTADGSIDARWRRTPTDTVADIEMTVTPPAAAAPDELPVSARFEGTYRGGAARLDVQDFNLVTRATRLTATGLLGATSGDLKVAVNTTDLGEWKPVIATFGGPKQLPIELRGRGEFDGTVTGKFSGPTVAGRLQVANFDSLLAPTPIAGVSPKAVPSAAPVLHRVHWDTMTASVEYSPTMAAAHNAVLRHGNAQINFDLAAHLSRGTFNENSPFTIQAAVRNANVQDVMGVAGYNYPISGSVSLSLRASGTEAAPEGSASFVLTGANVYGEPFQRISSDVRFANREAQFTNVNAAHNGAAITGTAAYNLVTTAYRFDLRGANINLANVQSLKNSRVSLGGLLHFSANGSGTSGAPSVNAELDVQNLMMNGERVGSARVTATTTGDTLRLAARSNAANPKLVIDGTAQLRNDFPANIAMRCNQLDVDPLIRAFIKKPLTAHSELVGTLNVQGPLRTPRALQVTGDIEQLFAEVEHLQVRNDGPIRFVIAQQVAHVQRLRLVGPDTDINASGTVQLSSPRLMDLAANGKLNLKLLQTLNPEVVSYGMATVNVHVSGEVTRPLINGEAQITNGAISYIDLPNGLSDINGRLVFNQDRLHVEILTGRTGGGTLQIGGFISYGPAIAFNLTGTGRDVRLRYPPGVSSMADEDLRLTGDMKNALLSGDITVTKFGVNPQFDFSQYLARAKMAPETTNSSSPLAHLRLDVHIVSTPELQVQTSLAKISGDVDLRLRGTAARPVVLGRVNIVEGEVSFNSTKYHLERGDITFSNPVRIEPVLDMEATTTVRDYDITLGFHGPTDKLSTTYRSDPPLPTADIVSLLAFGRTREETAMQNGPNTSLPETASYAILNQALNAAVSSRVQKIFGVSRIKIDPQTSGAESNPGGPTVTIEQQVSNKLTITYISNLSRANYQTIQAEFNVNRNVSVVAVRDWTGVVSFDVRVRQRRR